MAEEGVDENNMSDMAQIKPQDSGHNGWTKPSPDGPGDRASVGVQTECIQLGKDFLETTTAHGLAYTIAVSHAVLRTLWGVVITACYVYMLYSVTMVLIKYYAYPVQETTVITQEPVAFPDISLCSLDPVSSYQYDRLVGDTTSQLSWYVGFTGGVQAELENFLDAARADALGDRYSSTYGLFENLPLGEIEQMSHKQKDFIIQCRYGSLGECSDMFTEFIDPGYFRCFTLSLNSTTVMGSGPLDGISLILYLEPSSSARAKYNVFSPVMQGRGARLIIHSPGTSPDVMTDGVDVMPGHSTNVAISPEHVVRLPEPYGNCTNNVSSGQDTDTAYSSSFCTYYCRQKTVVQTCNCGYSPLPYYSYQGGQSVHLCGKINRADINISHSLEELLCAISEAAKLATEECSCPPACDTHNYDVTVSESAWPAVQFLEDFYETYVVLKPDGDTLAAYRDLKVEYDKGFPTPQIVQNSFIRLNVYFKSSESVVRSEAPSYDSSILLSDIGGTFGLWAGMSMLTLFEFIQLIGKVIVACCRGTSKGH